MAQNGQNRTSAPQEVNPAHIVSVKDFSPDTLRNVIAHLKASTSFEHLVYREAELDAIWTITGFLRSAKHGCRLEAGATKYPRAATNRRALGYKGSVG